MVSFRNDLYIMTLHKAVLHKCDCDMAPNGYLIICPQDEESGGKRWLHMFEPYRRLKEEDPIIPFGEGPIISKWGAISRASRTGFHTTDPVQATASQGCAGTTSINFRG